MQVQFSAAFKHQPMIKKQLQKVLRREAYNDSHAA